MARDPRIPALAELRWRRATASQKWITEESPDARPASPLPKSHGWGVHYDVHGRIALAGVETAAYAKFTKEKALKQLDAMRSKHA